VDEVWVAIATQAGDGSFVEEWLRDVFFGVIFDAALECLPAHACSASLLRSREAMNTASLVAELVGHWQ
jgi:hypothetical protein